MGLEGEQFHPLQIRFDNCIHKSLACIKIGPHLWLSFISLYNKFYASKLFRIKADKARVSVPKSLIKEGGLTSGERKIFRDLLYK